jgi:hypothetical protein
MESIINKLLLNQECKVADLEIAFNNGAQVSNSGGAVSSIDFALAFNPSIEILRCLIEHGAKIDCNTCGSISKALESSNIKFKTDEKLLDVLNFLKQNKANVNQNSNGIIYHALELNKKSKIINWLCCNGAKIKYTDISKALKCCSNSDGLIDKMDTIFIKNTRESERPQPSLSLSQNKTGFGECSIL